MFQFPFGTMHQLNLDWFLQKFNELVEEWSTAEAGIDGALQAEIDRVEAAMTDLYAARDAAVNAADAAVPAAASAVQNALISEGFALGEQNGTPVGAGSPYYQANAKFYSTTAGTYRYLSEAYARGTMGGTPVDPGDAGYEDNAKYYKDAADADAVATAADRVQTGLDRTATGNDALATAADRLVVAQDKLDVDTMKDNANQAALRSEGYSSGTQNGTPVGSGSPYYENNAAYFYGQSAGTSGALAQAMIATDEPTNASSAEHPAGSYFRMNGILYRATVDIDIGDTILPGSNCEQDVLADNVEDIESNYKILSPENFLLQHILCPDYELSLLGRTIRKTFNHVEAVYKSTSTENYWVNITGTTPVNIQGLGNNVNPPGSDDYCIPVSQLSVIDCENYLKIKCYSTYTGSTLAYFVILYYNKTDDVYTYLSKGSYPLRNTSATRLAKITIPDNATHFALFTYSGGAPARFDLVFNITEIPTI